MTEQMYEKITDHESGIKARSIWQYADKDIFDKLREAYAERTQEYENILWRLLTERSLSESKGVNLDVNGEYYQVERNGLSDKLYRNEIYTARDRLQAAGQIEILLDALRRLAGNDDVTLNQVFPATVLMHIFVDFFGQTSNQPEINNTMQKVKAAGIRLIIGEQVTSNPAFIFSDNPSGGESGQGFSGFPDGTDGGVFAKITG